MASSGRRRGGGGGGGGVCVPCPPGHVTAEGGRDCVQCRWPRQYNRTTRTCTACPPNSVEVSGSLNGSLVARHCVACAADAVMAGGVCRRCHYPHLAAADGTCSCPADHVSVAGVCAVTHLWNKIANEKSMYMINFGGRLSLESPLLRKFLRPAIYMCKHRGVDQWCHLLVNLCTITLYERRQQLQQQLGGACDQLLQLQLVLPSGVPQLYYADDEADAVLSRTRIGQQYTVDGRLQTSYLNVTVARYSLAGRLLSLQPLSSVTTSLCPSLFSQQQHALRFGERYRSSCTLQLDQLLAAAVPTDFYQLYLYHRPSEVPHERGTSDRGRLYSLPVRVLNYRSADGDLPNQSGSRQRWQLVHRFFLLDTVSSAPDVTLSPPLSPQPSHAAQSATPQLIRYVSSVQLDVEMRTDESTPGLIYPPLVTLGYSTVTVAGAPGSQRAQVPPSAPSDPTASVTVTVAVNYSMKMAKSREQIEVAVGVLSAFAALWSVFRTWAWCNRHGRTELDLATMVQFLVSVCSSLAVVLLGVSLGCSVYWLIFFKQQTVAFLLLPDHQLQQLIAGLVIAAFCLKTVDVVYVVVQQVTVDIFLLDWERPAAAGLSRPLSTSVANPPDSVSAPDTVSIWRTYFIANEWNELQVMRKISSTLRLVALIFTLQVLGVIDLAASTPDSRLHFGPADVRPPDDFVCRFAVTCVTFVGITALQWLCASVLLERYIRDPLQLFVSLCSLSNVSVLLLTGRRHGYYIHGRSVHGSAQADLVTLHRQLRRERLDLCARRGLAAGTDRQTFQLLLTNTFRQHYHSITAPLHSVLRQTERERERENITA